MDGSREQPQMTAGLDLGDKYSYLCLIDTQNGEVVEEGRLRITPEDLRRRFASEPSLRIATETGGGGHSEEALCALAPPVGNSRGLRPALQRTSEPRAGGGSLKARPRSTGEVKIP